MSNYNIDEELMDFDNYGENSSSSNHNPGNSHRKNKKHGKRRSKGLLITCILLLLTTITFIILFLFSLDKTKKLIQNHEREMTSLKEETENQINNILASAYTEENVNKMVSEAYTEGSSAGNNDILAYIKAQSSQKGASLAEMLRQLYKDEIVYLTNDGYEFTPINKDYPSNNVNASDLILDDNKILSYVVNGETLSSKGIDVSEHQGEIDWTLVAEDGVDFAMIRIGYRGYGSGKLVDDAEYENNITGALENNIDTGVYYFTQAINIEEMQEELDIIFEAIKPYKFNGPVAIDIEKVDGSNARANNLSKEERTELVLYFCEKVRAAGYTPMIYGNTNSLFAMLDIEQVHNELIWFAFYNPDYLYYPYELEYWQYTAAGTVNGIKGDVDLNIRFNK